MKIDENMKTALDLYAKHLVKNYEDSTAPEHKEHLPIAKFNITFEPGMKFIRVVTSSYGSRSAHSFVDEKGLIWKAASWKTPAKNFPRGSVFDPASYTGIRWSGGMEGKYHVK